MHASKGGPRNAGTICFQEKWFEGDKFPRHVMRECGSVREGVLMHNKAGVLPILFLPSCVG